MSDDPPAFQLFTEIGIIDQLAGTAFERVLPAGMTRAQFTVLHHLVRRGESGLAPAQLADAIQVTRATMTSTLARLERRGLVSLSPDPSDGRSKRVALTPAGREMRDSCIALVAPLLPPVIDTLTDKELGILLALLARLRAALDAARD